MNKQKQRKSASLFDEELQGQNTICGDRQDGLISQEDEQRIENLKAPYKLPKQYYPYIDADIASFSKEEISGLSFSFTTYQICKLEQYCFMESANVASIIRQILVDNNILDESDIVVRERAKLSSEFTGKNCEVFKGLKSYKVVHVIFSKYAKAKIIKAMIRLERDHTFFIKSKLVKNTVKPKPYQVLNFEDLGN